jgi:GNAT superfamily N-acetyltransferase
VALPPSKPPPPGAAGGGKDYKIRALKRSDRDAVFKLLAADGWVVPAGEQETAISWIVQHPEMDSFVAHDAASFSRVFGFITLTHRPQLRLAGRVGCIDAFAVAEEARHRGIGSDLLDQVLRRAAALGCKRIELSLPTERDGRHDFFEQRGFAQDDSRLFVLKK